MAIKSKKNKSVETSTKKQDPKISAIDKKIAEQREIIEKAQKSIKELLAEKLNAALGDIKVGDTIYYPAPPQKQIIACKLEIEEDVHGDITYFARPICYKKDGTETLSKRHYSLGKDLSACDDVYKDAPKDAKKKPSAKKEVAKKTKEVPKNSAKVDKTMKTTDKPESKKTDAKKVKLGKKIGKK